MAHDLYEQINEMREALLDARNFIIADPGINSHFSPLHKKVREIDKALELPPGTRVYTRHKQGYMSRPGSILQSLSGMEYDVALPGEVGPRRLGIRDFFVIAPTDCPFCSGTGLVHMSPKEAYKVCPYCMVTMEEGPLPRMLLGPNRF